MRTPLTLPLVGAVLVLAVAKLPAQATQLRYVDDRPVVSVTLRAGENAYPCHLLVDLARSEALFLHGNAAQALGATECDLVSGELTLKDLPVDGGNDRWLESFTARNAEGLREIPLAGYLGLAAFRDHLLVLDGPGQRLELRSADAAVERPPADASCGVLDLVGDPERVGLRFRVELGSERSELVALVSKEGASFVKPSLAKALGAATGRLTNLRAGTLDLAGFIAFRPEDPPTATGLTLGGRALAKTKLSIAIAQRWLALETRTAPAYPEDEAAFHDALFGEDPAAGLAQFLAQHEQSAFRAEAARARLPLVFNSAGDDAERAAAAKQAIEAAPPKARAREAIEILERVADREDTAALRSQIAQAGMPFAKDDEDGNAIHRLRIELGRLARRSGDMGEARRHLLSAVFGMPGNGPANLELGRVHEAAGELERAQSRYLLALLDAKNSGEDDYLALEALHDKLHPRSSAAAPAPSLAATLAELAEGRVPALHPIPREPEEIVRSGKVILLELFTGAQCPPCAAADVAFDALGEQYGTDEVALIQWHLPVPAPEPLVSDVAEARAKQKGIRGTPTLVLDGKTPLSGGGKADQAGEVFAKYENALKELLKLAPAATLSAEAKLEGRHVALRAHASATASDLRLHAILVEGSLVFPGRNGILFHHRVARGALTPADGVPLAQCSEAAPFTTRLDLDALVQDLDACIARFETEKPFRVRPTEPVAEDLSVVLFLEARDGSIAQAATIPVATAQQQR